MEWNFYTLSAVFSGGILVIASLAGATLGTAKQRAGVAAVGALSIGYGIWVGNQISGIYFFLWRLCFSLCS
jgi:hypothetical protein